MSKTSDQTLHFTEAALEAYCHERLLGTGLSREHVAAMSRVMVCAERDECRSHGVYRLLTCLETMRSGKVERNASPRVTRQGAITRVDAGFGFSPLAFDKGLPCLVEAARAHGIAALIINHCFHFSALWTEIEALTVQGLVALAMNPSHAVVAPAGGVRPTLGTNPMAFGWPRLGPHPYVFDFATSAVARGEIELHRRAGRPLPEGCGVDAEGRPTTDAQAILDGAMSTFGGHKGSALSTMIELMAGVLIADWTSQEAIRFEPRGAACHGALILAFDLQSLAGVDPQTSMTRAEALFESMGQQGARLPSQRRYEARARSAKNGIYVPLGLINDIDEQFSKGSDAPRPVG